MNMEREYQMCTRCVMDTSDPVITFDGEGVCNHCHEMEIKLRNWVVPGDKGKQKWEETVQAIKEAGKNKPYDCILGLSGGVDSSYVALLAREYDLRPLVVHFDNGWNSELAVMNIENIVSKLDFDLYTLVVNWEEFRDLQVSYFKSHVIDLEVPTDHAISGTMYKLARKYGIKYSLHRSNVATEGILPNSWVWAKSDHINLTAIHRQFGSVKLKTYPIYRFRDFVLRTNIAPIIQASPLNYIDFHKSEAKAELMKKLGWRDYGGKHYESVFTKFYQGYILPTKFGVDKRKAHLASLIGAGQLSREAALEELKTDPYPAGELEQDTEYVIKKLGFNREWFEEYLQAPAIPHDAYPTNEKLKATYNKVIQVGRKVLRKA